MISAKHLSEMSQKKALHVFKLHAKNVPFYRDFLRDSNIHHDKIKTIHDFEKHVPILDKEKLFAANLHNIREIFSLRSLKECRAILPSSGFSGKFSFGVNTKKDSASHEKHVDTMLDYIFSISRKRTLLINSLCMGINVPSRKAVTVNTGPRMDMVISVVKTFSNDFDQIIIIGDNCLLKNIIESGIEEGVRWQDHTVHLILGGDSFPENFRSYLAHLMKIDIDSDKKILIGSSFGIAEMGINVMWETANTIGIRRAASLDSNFRVALLGSADELCPMLFHYHPLNVYVESVHNRLLFTNLNPNTVTPLVRYSSGDMGFIIPYDKVAKALREAGLQKYIPDFKLPIVAVKERLQYLDFEGTQIFPSLIKNALYSDFELPGTTTGYFRIAQAGTKMLLEIQLKQGVIISEDLKKRFNKAVAAYVRNVHFELKFYPYREFQYGMGVDYERKFQYMFQCFP